MSRTRRKDNTLNNVLKFFCILGLTSVLVVESKSLMKALNEEEKEPIKIEKKETTPKKVFTTKSSIDLTYDYIRDYYKAFRGYLNYGLYDDYPCVKMGCGIPVTIKEINELQVNKNDSDTVKFLENADSLYFTVLNEKSMDYSTRIPNEVIRAHTKNFLAKRENYYTNLCQIFGFDYKDVPYKARAAIFCIDAATGFKDGQRGIGSYEKLLKAIKAQNWKKAAEESSVSDKVFRTNNPHITSDAVILFNDSIRDLFISLDKEHQTYVRQQQYLKERGASL